MLWRGVGLRSGDSEGLPTWYLSSRAEPTGAKGRDQSSQRHIPQQALCTLFWGPNEVRGSNLYICKTYRVLAKFKSTPWRTKLVMPFPREFSSLSVREFPRTAWPSLIFRFPSLPCHTTRAGSYGSGEWKFLQSTPITQIFTEGLLMGRHCAGHWMQEEQKETRSLSLQSFLPSERQVHVESPHGAQLRVVNTPNCPPRGGSSDIEKGCCNVSPLSHSLRRLWGVEYGGRGLERCLPSIRLTVSGSDHPRAWLCLTLTWVSKPTGH